MRSAQTILDKGSWETRKPVATVQLSFHDRYRRRIVLRDLNGEDFLLNLSTPAILCDGDGLLLDDGGVIAVKAAQEAVADIRAATAAELARLAWHIGNRHTPVQILDDGLRIQDDAVLVKMSEGLGGTVTRLAAIFSPEPGAYAQARAEKSHDHHHHDHHDHDHHDDHHGHHHD